MGLQFKVQSSFMTLETKYIFEKLSLKIEFIQGINLNLSIYHQNCIFIHYVSLQSFGVHPVIVNWALHSQEKFKTYANDGDTLLQESIGCNYKEWFNTKENWMGNSCHSWSSSGCALSLYTHCRKYSALTNDTWKCCVTRMREHRSASSRKQLIYFLLFFGDRLFVISPSVFCFITASLQGHLFLDLSLDSSPFLFCLQATIKWNHLVAIVRKLIFTNWHRHSTALFFSFFFSKTRACIYIYLFCSASPAEVTHTNSSQGRESINRER